MIRNRQIAFWFRTCAAVGCLIGILAALDIHHGRFNSVQLLYFTFQSNFIVLIAFVVLAVKTRKDMRANGKIGSCHYFPLIHASLVFNMIIVALIFWLGIAPFITNTEALLTFGNFATHLINVCFIVGDYALFSQGRHLTRKTPFLFLIFPFFYVVQASILGFAGVEFTSTYTDGIYSFPYPFMDWYRFGGWTILLILALAVGILAVGYIMYFIDSRRKAEPAGPSSS